MGSPEQGAPALSSGLTSLIRTPGPACAAKRGVLKPMPKTHPAGSASKPGRSHLQACQMVGTDCRQDRKSITVASRPGADNNSRYSIGLEFHRELSLQLATLFQAASAFDAADPSYSFQNTPQVAGSGAISMNSKPPAPAFAAIG